MSSSLRTPECKERYSEYLKTMPDGCPLCEKEPLQDFGLWRIVDNSYPYDRIAKVHHMIIPARHVSEDGLTKEEQEQFRELKNSYIADNYDWIIEATHNNKSLPAHFHLHLLISTFS